MKVKKPRCNQYDYNNANGYVHKACKRLAKQECLVCGDYYCNVHADFYNYECNSCEPPVLQEIKD